MNFSIKDLVVADDAKAHLKCLLNSPCFVIALKTPHPPWEWPDKPIFSTSILLQKILSFELFKFSIYSKVLIVESPIAVEGSSFPATINPQELKCFNVGSYLAYSTPVPLIFNFSLKKYIRICF